MDIFNRSSWMIVSFCRATLIITLCIDIYVIFFFTTSSLILSSICNKLSKPEEMNDKYRDILLH